MRSAGISPASIARCSSASARTGELGEQIWPTPDVHALKALVELGDQPLDAVQAVLDRPALKAVLPWLPVLRPRVEAAVQPSVLLHPALEAPAGRDFVELLPVPLDDDHAPIAAEHAGDSLEHRSGIGHVMQRRARHDRVDRCRKVGALELDALVGRAVRRRGIHADSLVAVGKQRWDKPAEVAAPDFDNGRGRRRQPRPDARPHRRQPQLLGVHDRSVTHRTDRAPGPGA